MSDEPTGAEYLDLPRVEWQPGYEGHFIRFGQPRRIRLVTVTSESVD